MGIKFSERYNYSESKEIQLESMDDDLRTRLYNMVIEKIKKYDNDVIDTISKVLCKEYFIIDVELSYKVPSLIKYEIFEKVWYVVYDFIEFIVKIFILIDKHDSNDFKKNIEELNRILEKEKAEYRYIGDQIVPITDENEIKSIQETINSKYDSVNIHLKKALEFYSNREKPDYENSIKESISAVEAICCIIVGNDKAVLSSALDRLSKLGVKIHSAQIEAFKKLYGYTSDSNGIRHAGIEFQNSSFEDAKYMLVSCSSFINYLIIKYESIKEN